MNRDRERVIIEEEKPVYTYITNLQWDCCTLKTANELCIAIYDTIQQRRNVHGTS